MNSSGGKKVDPEAEHEGMMGPAFFSSSAGLCQTNVTLTVPLESHHTITKMTSQLAAPERSMFATARPLWVTLFFLRVRTGPCWQETIPYLQYVYSAAYLTL